MNSFPGSSMWRALLSSRRQSACLAYSFSGKFPKTYLFIQKKHKTSKSVLTNIVRWNYENKLLFGPLQKNKTKSKKNDTASKLNTKTDKLPKSKKESTKTGFKDVETKNIEISSSIPRLSRISKKQLSEKEDSVTWWNQESVNTVDSSVVSDLDGPFEDIPRLSHVGKSDMDFSKNTSGSFLKFPVKNFSEGNDLNIEPVPDILDSLEYVTKCPLASTYEEDTDIFFKFKRYVEQLSFRTLPSVNTVISKTQADMSKFFLQRWREKMIGELGEDGFKRHQENTYRNGIQLHANVQQYLSGKSVSEIQIMPGTRNYWDSLDDVLPFVKDVVALESSVIHPFLFYKGTFDCVALYRDTMCVIDWKTSSKPKPLLSNTFDNPLQVAAYVGAINSSQALWNMGVEKITNALIVVTYADGHPAHVHQMDEATCELYWQKWLERLRLYFSAYQKTS